jgi:hypothetical protein
MPMEARLLLGFLGFSWNSVMRSSPSTLIMPKRGASDQGTSITEMVQTAPAALWRASMRE